MKNPSKISHPLKNRTGTSQRTRVKEALTFETAPIDGKTLADRLYIISEYAQQINFYEHHENEIEGEYQKLTNWMTFFKNSLPFRLAILSKISIDDLENEYLLLSEELKTNPSKESLELLLEFVFSKIISPLTILFNKVDNAENSFTIPLSSLIKSTFIEPLKSFISLYNASVTFLCISKKSFADYMSSPWLLKVYDVYALNPSIQQSAKGKKEAYIKANKILNTLFYQMLGGLDSVIEAAPNYIEESLIPLENSLQKKHEPHLALLFTFLELFKHFQGNINELSKKHLDFFYERVLKMIPKEAVPDKAHIVFEIAKHLNDGYPLPKDLLLKDGKDLNKQDIRFGLDHEILLDKAKITDLRTFSLHPAKGNSEFIEGVYMAPVANSVDGKGKKFKKDEPNNWATLGSKNSKLPKEVGEDEEPGTENLPNARLGFVLASPVLLLQEGTRTIRIILNCDLVFDNNEDGAHVEACLEQFITAAGNDNNPLFKVWFSGEKEWIPATYNSIINHPIDSDLLTSGTIQFVFDIVLNPDVPAVTFFDEKALKEKISLKERQPVVKIELNEEVKINCGENPEDSGCCLEKRNEGDISTEISPYNFLRHLKLVNANIDVKVCGVKKLIVQNDEGALDINSQIFPFGLRPDVPGFDPMNQAGKKKTLCDSDNNNASCLGPSFYIGSKEVLYKKWECIRVNLEWKEKPDSFRDYYKAYLKDPNEGEDTFELDKLGLDETKFKLKIDELNDGRWVEILPELESKRFDLFSNTKNNFCESKLVCNITTHGWEIKNDENKKFVDYNEPLDFFKNSLNGFLKFTLADQDFLHKEYPFVLARQMLAYALLNEDKTLTDAIYLKSNKTVIQIVQDIVNGVELPKIDEAIDLMKNTITALETSIIAIFDFIDGEDDLIVNSIKTIEELIELVNDYIIKTNLALNAAVNFETETTNIAIAAEGLANAVGAGAIAAAQALFDLAESTISAAGQAVTSAESEVEGALNDIAIFVNSFIPPLPPNDGAISIKASKLFVDILAKIGNEFDAAFRGEITKLEDLFTGFIVLLNKINIFKFLKEEAYQALIPNEPWTPTIKNLYIDYSASAIKEDMDIIHLYPYKDTTKLENIDDNPTLFPFFDKEGELFIGIDELTVGGSLSILFQLAEATADSELDKAKIEWHYLSKNTWVKLRTGFDIISDETDGLTVSGIVTIAVPENINKEGNTLMPDHLHWLKVSTSINTRAIAETIGIHTQAAKTSARFNELNDRSRLNTALEAGGIAKLVEGDFSVKKVEQLYSSFGGRKPEVGGHFYTRVSEHLKHKGRALMLTDYEKIVLEGFPNIYKAKCISHTMGLSAHKYRRDLEIAPGYVVVTVIPDLTKLKAGNQLEPKVPVSLLEKIGDHIRNRTSPFARLKVMNPRYEFVNVSISVRLYRGKSSNFYKQKLKEDITLFLAPWFLGDSEKLAFGQNVIFSDVVGFVEQLDYVDFIANLQLNGECNQTGSVIKPLTARSILTAGKMCVNINEESCPGETNNNDESCFDLADEVSPNPRSIN